MKKQSRNHHCVSMSAVFSVVLAVLVICIAWGLPGTERIVDKDASRDKIVHDKVDESGLELKLFLHRQMFAPSESTESRN